MRKNKRRRYTKVDRDIIRLRAFKGELYSKIAKDYGVTKSAIAGLVFRMRHPDKVYHYPE